MTTQYGLTLPSSPEVLSMVDIRPLTRAELVRDWTQLAIKLYYLDGLKRHRTSNGTVTMNGWSKQQREDYRKFRDDAHIVQMVGGDLQEHLQQDPTHYAEAVQWEATAPTGDDFSSQERSLLVHEAGQLPFVVVAVEFLPNPVVQTQ